MAKNQTSFRTKFPATESEAERVFRNLNQNKKVVDIETLFKRINDVGLFDGNKGDVSVSNNGDVWTINQEYTNSITELIPTNHSELNLDDGTNPHETTKSDVGLSNVVNLDTSTTANIIDSTDKRFVTDANLTLINNTSGVNTGDETNATIKTKLGVATTSTDGYLTSANWNTFNNKEPAIASGNTLQYWRGDKSFQTLNTTVVPEGTNLYFTNARALSAAPAETATTISAIGHGSTLDTSPLDADEIMILDSSASFSLKRTTWTSIKAFLLTYFTPFFTPANPGTTVKTATTNTTTTSATFVNMNSMLHVLPAGKYGMTFSTTLTSNTVDAIISISVFIDGTQLNESQLTCKPNFTTGIVLNASIPIPVSITSEFTVTGTETVFIRWKITSGTATANERIMSSFRKS